ncbi:MAG: carboxymuconolactone decarboxylase family protein [Deltaproteobacteria bacterium]|nr:carboxymuconolactone decarboxylase family protein [Deltaproteobacteria bacterium]
MAEGDDERVAEGDDERVARGLATALELFKPGSAVSPPRFEYPKEIAEDWGRLSMSTVMGDVWGRPGLEKKQRALITIALLTALDKPEQLRAYVTGGLNLGLSREEICEAIVHVSVYAGFPATIQGLGVANEVFDAFDAASDQ